MTRDARNHSSPLPWLVDWLREASCQSQGHSLVLAAANNADLAEVSRAVATYLNEFDGDGGSQWRSFGSDLLTQLAGDFASRELLLNEAESTRTLHPLRPDLERIVRRLARIGGVIPEGPVGLDPTSDLPGTFHICLSSDEPADHLRFHMWINPRRFSRQALVCVIADSFLNWTCHATPLPPPAPEPPSTNPPRHYR